MNVATPDFNHQMPRSPLRPFVAHCDAANSEPQTIKSDQLQVAELRNGKVVFRQKPFSFDNHSETMQEIVAFRSFLEASSVPLATIPNEHLPLIAKLVHESDKTLNALIKSLQSSLVAPILESQRGSEAAEASSFLPASAIEQAINAVATRTNYGIATDADRPPAALGAWRWEVKNTDWLPKSAVEKVMVRQEERVAAKKHLQATFDDLSAHDKESILKAAKQNRPTRLKAAVIELSATENQVPRPPYPDQAGEISESGSKKLALLKEVDPEAEAREKGKQEKKAAKAEKEKKAVEATKRSAAAFANFFKPTAQSAKFSRNNESATAEASSSTFSPTSLNEFQATFKPFVLKKGSQLAPINWFIDKRKKEIRTNLKLNDVNAKLTIIEIDIEERVLEVDDQPISSIVEASEEFYLRSPLNIRFRSAAPVTHRLLPSRPAYCVRHIMNQLIEAEIQRDHSAVRRLTTLLKNRRKVPAKVFVFAENNRPGYLGTWTRSSSVIRPRRPFARDSLSLDYDYDSDAEWEEDVDDAEDVDSQDEAMDDDLSSAGSEMDGFLVDADEIDIESLSVSSSQGCNNTKRKAVNAQELPQKKRKVIPLIPFQKGPIWEREIGRCEYENFQSMRLQLFNDTPFPLDPFTFINDPCIPERKKESEAAFVVPALPGHLSSTLPGVEPSIDDIRGARRNAGHPQPTPKTTFPDAQVPLLLQKISESNTNSFAVLLDSLFQDIKQFGVKKNALEVKLREVAERGKDKKGWVVKEDVWIRHGLVKST